MTKLSKGECSNCKHDPCKCGRPPKFDSVEDMEAKIQKYFDSCCEVVRVIRKKPKEDENGKIIMNKRGKIVTVEYAKQEIEYHTPPTVSGLALALGTSRETLLDYQKKDGFSDTIKKAKLFIQKYNEEQLHVGKNVNGVIFSLMNNYGWKRTEAQEITGKDGKELGLGYFNPREMSTEELQKAIEEDSGQNKES